MTSFTLQRVRSICLLWLAFTACTHPTAQEPTQAEPKTQHARHPVTIAVPSPLLGIGTGERDLQGDKVVVRCATCHELPSYQHELPEHASEAGGPHAGLRFDHGELRCAACHDPNDYAALRLADARTVPIAEAQQLCMQCHGPQARAYKHGAHGGMRGHWDLRRGPRQRNACVSCHDPHEPAYPRFLPAPPPRDRFAGPEVSHD